MHDLIWKTLFWDWSAVALAATTLAAVWWVAVVEAKRRAPHEELQN